jgi:GDP-4-dehydro-6-deoxy-D-mannose reductase
MSVPADCGRDEPTAEAVAVTVEGTRRVVELAASLASRPRVLVTSSSHVYAPVSFDSPLVSEDSPTRPAGGYGKTKLAAEQIASEIARPAGMDLIIARAFQHAGPRQNRRMMLAQWASQLAEPSDEPIRVHTLDARVDLSDVRDVVRAYRLLATRAAPGVYNVGSGVSRRSGDLLQILLHTANSRRPIIELRPGTKQDPIADTSSLVARTGWRPEIPPEQTIADTWACWQR